MEWMEWMEWMDGVDLIICLAIWTLCKRWLPLSCAELLAISIASRNRLRFASLLEPIFEDFGGQNGRRNSIFEPCFAILFSNAFLHRFLCDFWRLETSKISISPRREHDFYKFHVFKKD